MAPNSPNFSGKWKLNTSENFEEYLRVMGVPDDKIEQMKGFSPVEQINQSEDTFNVTVTTPKGDRSKKFKVGVEIEDEVEFSGTKVKVVSHWKGNTLQTIITPLDSSKPNPIINRTLEGSNMVLVIEAGGVTCKRTFVRG